MAPAEEPESLHKQRRHNDQDEPRRRDRDDERRSRWDALDSGRDRRRSRERDRQRRRSHTPESSSRHGRARDRDGGRERRRSRGRRRSESRSRSRSGDRDRRRRRSRGDRDSHRRRRRADDDADPDLDRAAVAKQNNPLKRSGPLPSQQDSFAVTTGEEPEKPKEKPNMGTTGLLAAASNAVAQVDGSTVTLKYHEPPEARKPPPRDQWKLFVFKGADIVDTIDMSARSCWLIGRDPTVVDLPAEHPSISKQHAVIQFRHTEKRNEFGDRIGRVKPYLIDLESANGTMLNDGKVPDSRYLELRDKDMVQFGHSTREYVVMLAPRE